MAVSEDNQQVSITLPRKLVKQIEAEAKKENRSRSQQIAKIIIDHYNHK